MSVEEASSTQNSVPMETTEPLVTNGEVESSSDIESRIRQVLDGSHGDNVEEMVKSCQIIADSVESGPIPMNVIKCLHFLTNHLVKKNSPVRGISVIDSLLSRLQIWCTLTSLHSDLVQLCLAAKLLSPALKYLDKDITSISPDEDMDVKYVLQYFYYGGSLYASLKNFSRAMHFLEICLSVPSQQTTSAIQVVAYQKLVLISILIGEKLSIKLPTFHTSIPHICRLYTNLLQVAADEDSDKFAATVAQMTPYLEKHNNLGLAKQALESVRRKDLAKFQTMFVSLKLSSLAQHLKVPVDQVENRLKKMILSGEISAQICKKDDMVWFTKESNEFDNDESVHKLKESLEVCMESYQQTKELNKAISQNPKLLNKIMENENRQKDNISSSSWDFPAHGKSKKLLNFLE